MDYMSRPVEVRGAVVGGNPASITLATPNVGHSPKDCAELLQRRSAEECGAINLSPGPDGSFHAELPSSMRGCAYLLIPPLLDLLCDYKSYFLVSIPDSHQDIYLIVVSSSGEAKISRLDEARQGTSILEVTNVLRVPLAEKQFGVKEKDVVSLRITGLRE